ncbi:MAG: Hsp33 family molecular chaperone HslO [Clostridia bacterium]|jgi:molecular chaperone Hsp33|nr:Hsp33 family molecular chaperone HslO [Clostridia bacterium]
MAGLLTKMIAAEKKIKAACIDGTAIVDEAARRHMLSPIATAALGRTMMGALLLAANFKKKEHNLTIRVLGDGPLGGIIVTANGNFQVRGYVQEPGLELPITEVGKLDVGRAVGKSGYLHVTKDLQLKAPYTGTCKLVSGEIAEDFVNYLYFSEQTPAAVALGVLVNPDGSVLKAGGYLVQLLPDAEEDLVKKLEGNIAETLPVSTLMQQGISVDVILAEHILKGFNPVKLIGQETEFFCQCSKEKLEKTLISLGEKELSEIISEQGCAEITCHFCNQKQLFSREELHSLLAEAKS